MEFGMKLENGLVVTGFSYFSGYRWIMQPLSEGAAIICRHNRRFVLAVATVDGLSDPNLPRAMRAERLGDLLVYVHHCLQSITS